MDNPVTTAVISLGAGLALLTAGFAGRNTTAGVAAMAIGIVLVLTAVGYYIAVAV